LYDGFIEGTADGKILGAIECTTVGASEAEGFEVGEIDILGLSVAEGLALGLPGM